MEGALDWGQLLDPRTLTLAGAFLIALIGGHRGWWMYGPTHKEIVGMWRERLATEERRGDAWQRVAMDVTGTAEKLAEVAKLAEVVKAAKLHEKSV